MQAPTPVPTTNMYSRRLRQRTRVDYRLLSDVKIPRSEHCKTRVNAESQLYRCRVVDRDACGQVKVHYIGYGRQYDEWKAADEVVSTVGEQRATENTLPTPSSESITQFSLYRVLGNQIKSSLRAGRKDDPKVRIEIPFDRIQFDGGLRRYGHFKKVLRGNEVYSITAYSDLDCLLDKNWHVRGITAAGDFCYVILDTVQFYLLKRRPLIDYIHTIKETERDQGHCLIFSFVRGDGTHDRFGIDSSIFVQ